MLKKGSRRMITVLVNGKKYEVERDKKLMRFLRDDLHLTSVKDGCESRGMRYVYCFSGWEGNAGMYTDALLNWKEKKYLTVERLERQRKRRV